MDVNQKKKLQTRNPKESPGRGTRRSELKAQHAPVSLARALSKLGLCSRTRARALIAGGRVRVNGKTRQDPETRVDMGRDRIEVDGSSLAARTKTYRMLNKPRGLITTASDERGRLDLASEGLLLFTNDTRWADRLLSPESHIEKTYHVQVNGLPDEAAMRRMTEGIVVEDGECLAARSVRLLRRGSRNTWLEVVLDEGRNRHIRRMLKALGFEVLRLVRVAVGPLRLGDLPKGGHRPLTSGELHALSGAMDALFRER